jgi:hypothetical protein
MPFQEPLFEHHHVTPAEAEVLRELANGLSAEEIAERLRKTPRAVRATLERFAAGRAFQRGGRWSGACATWTVAWLKIQPEVGVFTLFRVPVRTKVPRIR